MERGTFGIAQSTLPPSTYPAWTTFMTGVGPGRHGLVDFLMREPNHYALRFACAEDRKTPTVWNQLSAAGKRIAVIGMPVTHPPEALNGCMISGFDSPLAYQWDESFVRPSSYFREITEAVGGYRFTACDEDHVTTGWHERAKGEIRVSLEQQTRVAEYLLKREPWDVFTIVFGQTDSACHHYWMFHDQESPRFPGRNSPEFKKHRGFLLEVYERIDSSIGRLMAHTGPNVGVLLVSDHGSGGAGNGVIYLNRWLSSENLLTFKTPRFRDRTLDYIKRSGLRWVPRGLKQNLFRQHKVLAGNIESRIRFSAIDFSNTFAFSEEMNSNPSIWINLKGRDPEGAVPPADYEALREKIIHSAESLRDPRTGEKLFNRVHKREELYQGPYIDRFADIILEPALEGKDSSTSYPPENGYSYSFLVSGNLKNSKTSDNPWFRELSDSEQLGARGRSMNGTHRPNGFFVMAGPGIQSNTVKLSADLTDFAPTVMAYLGVEPNIEMEGQVIKNVLDHHIGPCMSYPSTSKSISTINSSKDLSSSMMSDWETLSARRLKDLGYLE